VRGQSLVYADTGEGTKKTYFVTDDQGSVIQLLDDQGNIIKTYSYDAFGTEISKDNNQTDNNPFRYCGEYHDIETGYIYLRARYYNPAVGRFISENPDGLWVMETRQYKMKMKDPHRWGFTSKTFRYNSKTLYIAYKGKFWTK